MGRKRAEAKHDVSSVHIHPYMAYWQDLSRRAKYRRLPGQPMMLTNRRY
jgi:hypothetical protein